MFFYPCLFGVVFCVLFWVFFRWILNVCMVNFKTMTSLVVSGKREGKPPHCSNKLFSSFPFFLSFSPSSSRRHWYNFKLTPKCDDRKIQPVLLHTTFILFSSFRQADDPLTFKNRLLFFFSNPSYLVDKYFFCFVTLGESQVD